MKLMLSVLLGALIGGGAVYFFKNKPQGFLGFARFDPTVSGPISFKDANAMHRLYLEDCWHAGEDTTNTSLRYLRIDKKDITTLMTNLPDDGGLRIYFGDTRALDHQKILPGILTTFLVAVDGKGKLLISNSTISPNRPQDEIIDNLPPCPDNCPNPGDNPPLSDGFNHKL